MGMNRAILFVMNRATPLVTLAGVFFSAGLAAQAPQRPELTAAPPSIASVMQAQLSMVESQFVPAAEAMPEEKYTFVPTSGEFKGVRTFALEVKHVATANLAFYSLILEQEPPPGVTLSGPANGPSDVQSKEQILNYLKESFALGHKALATLITQNALTVLAKPPAPSMNTPLALATFSLAHASDHYGQIVECLRMNGIVPPASKGQPPANP
ncbi:MAG TPA: DinB family protein [Vicinamibacterales bacterium]|jgi:hypothetical protein|nr:DinB family protein [Vicinamibacterales bacterium]